MMTSEDSEFNLGGGNTSGVTCVNADGQALSQGTVRSPLTLVLVKKNHSDCLLYCNVACELVAGCLWPTSHCVRQVVAVGRVLMNGQVCCVDSDITCLLL